MVFSAPEMTTVSKPKRNPASAEVSDQKKMRPFMVDGEDYHRIGVLCEVGQANVGPGPSLSSTDSSCRANREFPHPSKSRRCNPFFAGCRRREQNGIRRRSR